MKSSSLASVLLVSCLISMVSAFSYAGDNKPTLLVFSADWCAYCQKAKNDINNDPELSNIVKNYYVVVPILTIYLYVVIWRVVQSLD
jgi:thioredoxin-related protein